MIQTPGKAQTPGTDVVTPKALASHGQASQKRSLKRTARMLGAGLVSAAMVGVFALPAYASPMSSDERLVPSNAAQILSTGKGVEIVVPVDIVASEELPTPAIAPLTPSAETGRPASFRGDIPAGVGAQGLVNAAMAQLGWNQDCTDLVQNSLDAIGLATSQANGGYDMGISDFYRFGTAAALDGSYAPGDILIWDGVHVAIYIGGGQAVHGGWMGAADITMIDSAFGSYGPPNGVQRL